MCKDIINSLHKRKGNHTVLICTSMVNFTGQSKAMPRSDLSPLGIRILNFPTSIPFSFKGPVIIYRLGLGGGGGGGRRFWGLTR